MRNGVAILSKNIKLDKNYKSVLNYTEQEMLELMTDNNNLVYSANDLSFTRESNEIILKVPYSVGIQANYLAFQNPDYSNKYFFAFIDEVEYLGEKQTKFKYTIDLFTTWWSYWSPKACYVIREHVTDDTIGKHTIPEGLETGDYITNGVENLSYGNYYYVASISEDLLNNDNTNKVYNGVPSGLTYIILKTKDDLWKLIDLYNDRSKIEAIYSIFVIPQSYQPSPVWRQWTFTFGSITITIDYAYVRESLSAYTIGDLTISRPSTIDSYSPSNNKCLVYPYQYLMVDNGCGGIAKYNYEYFSNPNECVFRALMTISAGCSIKIIPRYYKNVGAENYSESLNGAKLPVGAWINDVYTNWLTQNGVNQSYDLPKAIVTGAIGGGITGGVPGAIIGAVSGFAYNQWDNMKQKEIHDLAPNQAIGNTNSSDIMYAMGHSSPLFYKMCIREEYIKIIDKYFTRVGYMVNSVKLPNMTHRENYNYIQIGNDENLCYPNNHDNIMIPAKALNDINQLFRNGITIWNNHANFGDYSVSNNITN